ncbi:CorA family divalent cation transporter, partial [Pseudomonas aeruginosa]|uniref:CorA family divalent cation transporter n=1 Tax=Pseudomonas aeruginosa TaxID=287 RepID=UPI003528A555
MSRVFISPLATPFHSLVSIFPIPSRYISIFRAPPPRYFSPSLINEQNNRILFTLTMVTVLALPINIVAGFFGMNVGGIPFADDPEGFWIMLVLVASFTFLAGRWAFRKRGDY